ncbi:VOC family protein [Gordonia jinhuaensis]|uniref:VOC family protein n=2 Tax=Gordonia jinhuaensis TaxID=1517702 RepID=A0A916TBC0_9ACTN|nr:VOC family protein [Gordonia jinhuaensis]
MDNMSQKIVPCLWFDGVAREAVDFYVDAFDCAPGFEGSVAAAQRYPEQGLPETQKDHAGDEMMIEFDLAGVRFAALNAGPEFSFIPANSLMVNFGPSHDAFAREQQCGWCRDRFGVSWQIIPENLQDLLAKPGAFENLMSMTKIVIADL